MVVALVQSLSEVIVVGMSCSLLSTGQRTGGPSWA